MAFRAAMPTFAGGEIGKQVRARFDAAKYATALDKARNTLGLLAGGQYNRPGTAYCDQTADMAKASELIPFSFSADQSYALEFGDQVMRAFFNGAPVVKPGLIITAATATNPLTMTIPDSGYVVGSRVYFSGVEGMVQVNGLTLRVTGVVGNVVTFDADASGWSAFTGSGGGVAGNSGGGTGGLPPPPVPGDPEPPIPPYPDTDPEPPHTGGGYGDEPLEVLP
jgi:hypothetical protein